ncbi:uncharacterized protein LOC125600445 [Brassica napus]|uniref:uncharacterized protein LOC125600445 n=1 Tax=Brassica napus TaxID=3708 RepID=UPI002078925F|nr:uncharacterized protein LOC125600445 [Brassica napus]
MGRKIRTGLRAKKKLGFVDGTVKVPEEGSSITHREIAKELWDSIKARFNAKSEVKVQQLKEELMNCKQSDLSLETYYGKLHVVWEDLSNYEFKPVCSCGGCKCQGCACDFLRQLEMAREKEKLHQFCPGLGASLYGNVRTAIVNTDPLPSVDHAYAMVWLEKYGKGKGRGGKPSQQGNKGSYGKGASVNAVSHVAPTIDAHAVTGLSKEQWDKLVKMLGEKTEGTRLNGKKCRDDWIVDIGASHHMTGLLDCLFDIHMVAPCLVGLPNGKLVMADQEGSVRLTDTLKLHSVLYVKELKCNLISVSQLIDELNCIVLFSKTCCLMQDLTLMMPIGMGERRDGVYFLQGVELVRRVKKVGAKESLELWHKRLGHA